MSDLTLDPVEMAKTYQWEIEQIDDPVEAALEANKALITLNQISDERFRSGTELIVRAYGAYALRQWNEDEQRHVTLQFAPSTIRGRSAGIGFVQNIMGSFQLKTIFIGVRDSDIIEGIENSADGIKRVNLETVPRIVVPVLEIDTLQKAA